MPILPRCRKTTRVAIIGKFITPDEIVAAAKEHNCRSIAYTYTEPTIYFEFAHDTAKQLAHEHGLLNLFVTNGYMTVEALDMIGPYLDAANVDLKAFNDEFYKTYCGARLAGVKETLVAMKSRDIFLEITTLIIPGFEMAQMSSLIWPGLSQGI